MRRNTDFLFFLILVACTATCMLAMSLVRCCCSDVEEEEDAASPRAAPRTAPRAAPRAAPAAEPPSVEVATHVIILPGGTIAVADAP